MAGRGTGPDFVESLARGLDVLTCFDAEHRTMSLTEVAAAAGLARPTARRLLLTLAELGYVRSAAEGFSLTPRVLRLGSAYASSLGLWDVARPHLEDLVRQTGESSSMSQLDGCDIVYVARVAVPKIIALRVDIGTRFPAAPTSQGKVLLAALTPGELDAALAEPSRAGVVRGPVDRERLEEELRTSVGFDRMARMLDHHLHAAETSVEQLTGEHLPHLLRAASAVAEDWSLWQARPHADL